MSTTNNASGAVRTGPGRSGQRTTADVIADSVSLAVLLALGGFALAVSFSHTMQFVHDHGQRKGWVVVGTALTVVGLTVQAGLETYRDSRAGRGRGWPAALLALAICAELYANASTATGGRVARLVAAWPVLVAAAALALWTRRLQHAAEAAEAVAHRSPSFAATAMGTGGQEPLLLDEEEDQEQEEPAPDPLADELAELRTARERALLILARANPAELPAAPELGERAGCSRQHAYTVLQEWRDRPENQPGQASLDLPGVLTAAVG